MNADFQEELVWLLYRTTDMTQQEIADSETPFTSLSQASVSRIVNDYDPAEDGFTVGTDGLPDEATEEAKEQYREAVEKLLLAGTAVSGPANMIQHRHESD